jgi:ankyrin repeat protein
MSKKASKAEYKDAQAAQKFYSDSLNLLVAKKGFEFLEVLNKYVSDSSETAQSIFETYQSDGKHFLHVAASTACAEVVEFAMSCPNPVAFVNIADSHGFTPLINATVAESSDIMSLLIKHGADVNARNNDGATSLHFAAGDGSIERMQILCDAGCDTTLTSQAGSPISWAAGSGKPDAIR